VIAFCCWELDFPNWIILSPLKPEFPKILLPYICLGLETYKWNVKGVWKIVQQKKAN